MNKEFVVDRFAGCLLGLAVGDALGAPVDDMTYFQVMSAYHTPIDMFYPYGPFPAGKYTCETLSAMNIVSAITDSGGKLDAVIAKAAHERIATRCLYDASMGAKTLMSKAAPLGLMAAAFAQDGQEMVNNCKLIALADMKKRDVLATFLFAYAIKELIRNSDELQKPYNLYDSDVSLMARLIDMCAASEVKFAGEESGTLLSEYLGFARKKMMAPNWDLTKFVGVMGNSKEMSDSLAVALFAYMQAPDDFSTICKTVSMGGPASLRGALVGALIGATIGGSLIPQDMKDQVEKGVNIESRAISFAESCLPAEAKQIVEDQDDGNSIDDGPDDAAV